MSRNTPWMPEERDGADKVSIWDESPWFAIARFSEGRCVQVFLTKDWACFSNEFKELTLTGMTFKVWCGTYRDVEDFRRRCWHTPHEDDS